MAPVQAPLRDPEVVGHDCSNSASSTLPLHHRLARIGLGRGQDSSKSAFQTSEAGP